MKKLSITLSAAVLGVTVAVSSVVAYEYRHSATVGVLGSLQSGTSSDTDITSTYYSSSEKNTTVNKENLYSIVKNMEVPPAVEEKSELQVAAAETPKQEPKTAEAQTKIAVAPANTNTAKSSLTRGGTQPASSTTKSTAASKSVQPTLGKTELLDWWKQGNAAFPVNSVATVKDVNTGKTFKIKRTMGSNHADCEALTLEDTNIIKSIWGGFTWTTRPVHVIINGRTLAASMSSMPHAGVDSAPAFKVVDNRSVGYGRGENLDVVKGNGMDGHFDIHFLNSTRHKDGKIDPRHQESIKIAASK
jgi:hypothetical protein